MKVNYLEEGYFNNIDDLKSQQNLSQEDKYNKLAQSAKRIMIQKRIEELDNSELDKISGSALVSFNAGYIPRDPLTFFNEPQCQSAYLINGIINSSINAKNNFVSFPFYFRFANSDMFNTASNGLYKGKEIVKAKNHICINRYYRIYGLYEEAYVSRAYSYILSTIINYPNINSVEELSEQLLQDFKKQQRSIRGIQYEEGIAWLLTACNHQKLTKDNDGSKQIAAFILDFKKRLESKNINPQSILLTSDEKNPLTGSTLYRYPQSIKSLINFFIDDDFISLINKKVTEYKEEVENTINIPVEVSLYIIDEAHNENILIYNTNCKTSSINLDESYFPAVDKKQEKKTKEQVMQNIAKTAKNYLIDKELKQFDSNLASKLWDMINSGLHVSKTEQPLNILGNLIPKDTTNPWYNIIDLYLSDIDVNKNFTTHSLDIELKFVCSSIIGDRRSMHLVGHNFAVKFTDLFFELCKTCNILTANSKITPEMFQRFVSSAKPLLQSCYSDPQLKEIQKIVWSMYGTTANPDRLNDLAASYCSMLQYIIKNKLSLAKLYSLWEHNQTFEFVNMIMFYPEAIEEIKKDFSTLTNLIYKYDEDGVLKVNDADFNIPLKFSLSVSYTNPRDGYKFIKSIVQ